MFNVFVSINPGEYAGDRGSDLSELLGDGGSAEEVKF